jgi:hypothetical protein
MIFEHCPFETNQRYVVKKDIKFLTHVLKTGELVVFLNHTYDPKIGIQRFHFKTSDKKPLMLGMYLKMIILKKKIGINILKKLNPNLSVELTEKSLRDFQ